MKYAPHWLVVGGMVAVAPMALLAGCGDDTPIELTSGSGSNANGTGSGTGSGSSTSNGGAGGNGAASVGAGANGSGSGGSCSVSITFEPETPTVALLIDQSGSMTADFNGSPRWDVVHTALMDAQNGVLSQLEAQVRFGLALYTFEVGNAVCPQLVDVMPPALNNRSALDAVYAVQVPLANTPTGESIAAVHAQLIAFNEPGSKLILLATDGDPDRCDDPDGHDAISKQLAVDAASAAYADGVRTVIVAVGDQVSSAHQQDVANAGAGLPVPAAQPCNDPMVCAPTYEPATQAQMVQAFNAIINGQRTCEFTINGEVLPGKECSGSVTINGNTVPCNDPNGYEVELPSTVRFLGAACDEILNTENVSIGADFDCDSINTPN